MTFMLVGCIAFVFFCVTTFNLFNGADESFFDTASLAIEFVCLFLASAVMQNLGFGE